MWEVEITFSIFIQKDQELNDVLINTHTHTRIPVVTSLERPFNQGQHLSRDWICHLKDAGVDWFPMEWMTREQNQGMR